MSTFIRCFCILHVSCMLIAIFNKYATTWCVKIKNASKSIWIFCLKSANVSDPFCKVLLKKQVGQKCFSIQKCHSFEFTTEFFSNPLENCDLNVAQRSPITRNLQVLLSNTSPQTPKSRMLNTWNLENRNLKVCFVRFLCCCLSSVSSVFLYLFVFLHAFLLDILYQAL